MIDILDALCGAGKTFALSRKAHTYVERGLKVLFVQPTRLLIEATVAQELGRLAQVKCRVIHSGTHPHRVASEIIAHMEAHEAGGEILFITHAAFFALPYVPHRRDWIVIMDELPAVDVYEELNLPETHAVITSALDAQEHSDRYCILSARGGDGERHLGRIAANCDRDDVWTMFSGIATRTLSRHWIVSALDHQYQNLVSGHYEKRKLSTYSILQPSILEGYARVILAGACIRDSLLFHLWREQGVAFRDLNLPLRFTQHTNGSRLTISYGVEGSWSKRLRDATRHDGSTIMDNIVAGALVELGDEPFVYMVTLCRPATSIPTMPLTVQRAVWGIVPGAPNCHPLKTRM